MDKKFSPSLHTFLYEMQLRRKILPIHFLATKVILIAIVAWIYIGSTGGDKWAQFSYLAFGGVLVFGFVNTRKTYYSILHTNPDNDDSVWGLAYWSHIIKHKLHTRERK